MRCLVLVALLVISLCSSVFAEDGQEGIDVIVASIKNSFSSLSSKRDNWYNNYSHMKKHFDGNKEHLSEILLASKMAIPFLWDLYTTEVFRQKKSIPKLVAEHPYQQIPYKFDFIHDIPLVHTEMTLQLQKDSDFQIEMVLNDQHTIYLLQVDYSQRRLVFSDMNEDREMTERLVIDTDGFPAIQAGQDFRVNIQRGDNCIFTSFWVGDLSMATPMPLPTKYHWCSKIYHRTRSYNIRVADTPQTLEAPQEIESSEDTEETTDTNVTVKEVTVYAGLIIQ